MVQQVEVAVVGGGAAGLASALTLARACRSVAVFAEGAPRNSHAQAVRGFLSRDGHTPAALLGSARDQLAAYPRVVVRDERVTGITGDRDVGFAVRTARGALGAARVVLATGMVDQLPAVDGFGAVWGRDVFHCPYCHGWEARGRRWGVVAYDRPGVASRLPWLHNWTDDLVLFAGAEIDDAVASGVPVERRSIVGFVADGSTLSGVVLADGAQVPVGALLWPVPLQLPALIAGLGLALDEHGYVVVDAEQQTSWHGVYAAGDVSSFHRQQVTDAAAAGTAAAKAVVHDLTRVRSTALSSV